MTKKRTIKIYFSEPGQNLLEQDLKDLLEEYGYICWASGCDLTTGVRDLCFDEAPEGGQTG